MKVPKVYDEDGHEVPKSHQICKCGHSAGVHIQTGLHPMNGYRCISAKCKCVSFNFDHFK